MNDKWIEVLFSEDIDPADITNGEFMRAVTDIFFDRYHQGFAVFSDGAYARYLTPRAAHFCAKLVRDYGGQELTEAEVAAISPSWILGDSSFRNRFSQ